MNKKKIKLFLLSPLALENGRGGEISSMELASGLQKFYDITLFDTNIFIREKHLSKETINKKLKGIKKRGVVKFATLRISNKIFDFPYPWEIIKLFREIKKNNIIYTSVHNIKFSLLLIFSSLIFPDVKFIVGFRKPLHSIKLFSLYNIKYRISILLFSLFKKRFHFHTISEHARKFLENFYNPNRITHIIHGIELESYVKKSLLPEDKNNLKFIYVGYLDNPHKGVGLLLNAIETLLNENRNLKILFEFCGSGPLEKNLKKLEKRFPRFIKYNGYISNELIANYYKGSDVFIFTSRREPFGRVIIEALAAELIIICSKTIGSIEILKGKEFAFFLQDLNVRTIKDKIIELYNFWIKNPIKFGQLKKLAKNYALDNYSISKEILMFKNLIEKIRNKNA